MAHRSGGTGKKTTTENAVPPMPVVPESHMGNAIRHLLNSNKELYAATDSLLHLVESGKPPQQRLVPDGTHAAPAAEAPVPPPSGEQTRSNSRWVRGWGYFLLGERAHAIVGLLRDAFH